MSKVVRCGRCSVEGMICRVFCSIVVGGLCPVELVISSAAKVTKVRCSYAFLNTAKAIVSCSENVVPFTGSVSDHGIVDVASQHPTSLAPSQAL